MKATFVLFLIIAAVSADSTKLFQDQVLPFVKVCKEKFRATDDDVKSIMDLRQDLVSQKGKCFYHCVLEEMGIMSGAIFTPMEDRMELFKAAFADDPKRLAKGKDIVVGCAKTPDEVRSEDACDVAFASVVCVFQKFE